MIRFVMSQQCPAVHPVSKVQCERQEGHAVGHHVPTPGGSHYYSVWAFGYPFNYVAWNDIVIKHKE